MRANMMRCGATNIIRWWARGAAGLLCLVGLGLSVSHVRAQPARNIVPTSATESHWALLVGVEPSADGAGAAYQTNDVELLAATLRHCGYSEHHVLAMTRKASETDFQPLWATLMEQVPRFLRKIGAEDRLLVYFAGRAFQDREGRVYLAPSDWDAGNPDSTGLTVSWLREQLAACPAQTKLLVLDVGNNGSADGENVVCVGGHEVGSALEDAKGLVVLASCRKGENSLAWEPMGQSLFGFWFGQALAGHADRDHNNQVGIVEARDYVFEKVAKTAADVFGRKQTPVQLIDASLADASPISRTTSLTLRRAIDEIAGQLAAMAVRERVSRLGVAEFRTPECDSQTIQLFGGGFGLLGRWCAEELERCLAKEAANASGGLELIPHKALHATLARHGFSPASFRASGTRGVTVHGKKLQAAVLGSFCARTGRVLTLRCDLQDTGKQRLLGRVQMAALLNESEWAMLGHSGTIMPDDLPRPAAPSPSDPVPPEDQVGNATAKESGIPKESPPPSAPTGPGRVAIFVNGERRQSVRVGEDEYVPLAQGEVYKVVVENRGNAHLYLRLLVDGLNTLPEPVSDGSEERPDRPRAYLSAQRVSLDEAKAWRLGPRPSDDEASRYTIGGFYRRTGKDKDGKPEYEWDTFKVVDAPGSLASQQGYTEQIGLITAAFYDPPSEEMPRGRSRGFGNVGTGRGEKRQGTLEEYREIPVGRLRNVVNVHYVEPEVLDRLTREQVSAATLVTKYLAAADTGNPAATKPFLSPACRGDIATEFSANAASGWNFAAKETRITKETINEQEGKATVVVQMVFEGGTTFMAKTQTFILALEEGEWKISGMDPLPRKTGPGVIPLSR